MARADPVAEERQSLYERDFYLWVEQQAALLREGRLDELDVASLLEEIESMGRKTRSMGRKTRRRSRTTSLSC